MILLILSLAMAKTQAVETDEQFLARVKIEGQKHQLLHQKFKDLVNQEFDRPGITLVMDKCFRGKYRCEITVKQEQK